MLLALLWVELEDFLLWFMELSSSSGSSPSGVRVDRLKVAFERLSALPFLLVDGDE